MGFLDAILGRSKPKRPDLDQLFALPSAAVTLQAGAGFAPTGVGAVCFASVEGGAFAQLQQDVRALLDADTGTDPDTYTGTDPGPHTDSDPGPHTDSARGATAAGVPVEFSRDAYGYTWLLTRHDPADPSGLASLVNDLHAVNTLLAEAGFGPQLLCSLVGFRDAHGERPLALIYLYKRGTFYPFAPLPGPDEKRDNPLELQVRGLLTDDLRVEEDLSRWFPVWGAPGL